MTKDKNWKHVRAYEKPKRQTIDLKSTTQPLRSQIWWCIKVFVLKPNGKFSAQN